MNEENVKDRAQKNNFSREDLKELLRFLLIAAVIVLPIRYFIMQPFVVSGTSMDPTFHNNEYLIADKISYKLHKYKRGDVVILKLPIENEKHLIKRLIGLPGDTVILHANGSVTIKNTDHPEGFTVEETYLENHDGYSLTITIPEGKVFVLGDNRPVSYDSRSWGLLNQEKLVGRAYLRLWPLKHIDYLPGKTDLLNQ